MDCPSCGSPDSRVVKTMKGIEESRKRQCPCGVEWFTTETVNKGSIRSMYGTFRMPIPSEVIAQVMARDGGICRYCGTSEKNLGIDHVVPMCAPIPAGRSRDEETVYRNSAANLVACCTKCNLSKGDRVNGKRQSERYSAQRRTTNGAIAPPVTTTNPPSGLVTVGGVGVGLPSGSGPESGSESLSGPLSVSDPGEKTAPAREPEPEPNDIRLPAGEVTEYGIAKTFGFVRGREWPNAFPWTIPRSSPEKAAGIVTDANDDPDVRDDLIPTMVLLFAKAKAGKLGAKNIDDATVAFGWWVSKFTALREELHGRSSGPDDGKPVDPYCDDHRKPGSRGRRARRYSETCPECRHVAALNRTPSNGEPTTAAALLARGGS